MRRLRTTILRSFTSIKRGTCGKSFPASAPVVFDALAKVPAPYRSENICDDPADVAIFVAVCQLIATPFGAWAK